MFETCDLLFVDVRDQSRRQHREEVQCCPAGAQLTPAAQGPRTQQQQDEKPLLPVLQGEDVPVSMEDT